MSEKERPPSSKPLIGLYILGLVVQLILIGDPEDPIWTFLLIGIFIILVASGIIVYRDAKALESFAKAREKVSPISPTWYAIGTILAWLFVIPLYLYRKRRFLRSIGA